MTSDLATLQTLHAYSADLANLRVATWVQLHEVTEAVRSDTELLGDSKLADLGFTLAALLVALDKVAQAIGEAS